MTHSLCSVMFADNHTAGMKRVSVSQYASKLLRYLSMVNWDNMQEEGEIPGCAAAMVLSLVMVSDKLYSGSTPLLTSLVNLDKLFNMSFSFFFC